jgi:hypothetical protein
VRDMGNVMLAAERDRVWAPDNGDAVRGRYGSGFMAGEDHDGPVGDEGLGSVLRRSVGGFLAGSKTRSGEEEENDVDGEPSDEDEDDAVRAARVFGLEIRSVGTGEVRERNSSIRSVSGTGSMVNNTGPADAEVQAAACGPVPMSALAGSSLSMKRDQMAG